VHRTTVQVIPIRKRSEIEIGGRGRPGIGTGKHAVFGCKKMTPSCKKQYRFEKGGNFSELFDSRTKNYLVVASFHVVICWYP
jgi:hypothetical protein